MHIAPSDLTPAQRYKLLCGCVVPRPIAWITTLEPSGSVNAAPFSFFNAVSEDPVIVVVSINSRPGHGPKDTLRNIERTREFVVNIADEPLAEAMHRSSGDFPPGVSETTAIGLELEPCIVVAPPRIRRAPFSLECRLQQFVQIGTDRKLVIGEGLHLHFRDDIVDPATWRIREDSFFPIGRLYGDRYVHTRDRFSLPPANPPKY